MRATMAGSTPGRRWLGTARAVVQSDEYQALAEQPGHSARQQLVELIADVCGDALDANGRALLDLLAENGRVDYLPEIAEHFDELKAEDQNVADVEVVSAVALDEAQQQRLAGALRSACSRDVRLHCSVDPSLDRRRGRAFGRPAHRRLAHEQARTARHRTDDGLTTKRIFTGRAPRVAAQACRGLPTWPSRLLRSAN